MRFSILIPLFLSVTPFTAADWWLQAFTGENCSGQEVGSWVSPERHDQCENFDSLVPIKSVRGDASGVGGTLQVFNRACSDPFEMYSLRNECSNAGSWGEWKSFRIEY
ncbi:hypothetical protein IFM46972_00784 [Aspergillus udagawae]|uniref:Uncharacterized protein n=1 Tax=Aspergillus udagawae TaxID=91492 RepID=A0A8H3N037_9EURO|nr:hypothetical protein IFM46972_00784 [Aspergillus udagawae]